MIKGIIFHMDGVLINSEELCMQFEYKFLRNLGADITVDYIESFKGIPSKSIIDDIFKQNSITSLTKEDTLKLLNDGIRLIYTQNPKLRLTDGIICLLDYFKESGIPMVIVSSVCSDSIETVLEKFNINKYFKGYIGGEMIVNSKPDSEIFIKAAELLGLQPYECMAIEDSYNGIKAAKSAGCICAGYLNEGKTSQDFSLCDLIIDIFNKERVAMVDKFIKYHNIKSRK